MELCHWARKATVQQAQREKRPRRASARARARFLNLTGGAQLPVGERGGEREVRMTGGGRLSSLTSRPDGRCAHRRRCRARRVELTAQLDSSWSRRSGGGGGRRRSCLVRRRRGTAVEELREAVAPAVSSSYREGKTRGKGSGECRDSRSRQRRSGGGLYLANSGEPKRRSSSSISSSGGSGEELAVQGEGLVVQRASGEERRARGGL